MITLSLEYNLFTHTKLSHQDISMKKIYRQQQQQQPLKQRKTETQLKDPQSHQAKKPMPQIYSCHRIPSSYQVPHNSKSHHHGSITDIHNVESLHTNSNHYYSRVKQHGQYITQESIPLLQQRLRSIQQSYERLIAEEKNKSREQAEMIVQLIEEMQAIHSEKVNEMKRLIDEREEQKRDVGFVDNRMNEIKENIDELIDQSNTLKLKNGQLEKKIQRKRKDIKEMESQLQQLNIQLLQVRGQLESFQRNNLKNSKINRQTIELFNSAPKLSQSN